MKKNHSEIRLLPIHYKKIALVILSLTIIFVILAITKAISIEKEIAKTIATIGILIACLIFALTRNKEEDELTLVIRFKALAVSFLFGTLYTIIDPFINLVSGDDFQLNLKVSQILIYMFGMYFFNIYTMLKKR